MSSTSLPRDFEERRPGAAGPNARPMHNEGGQTRRLDSSIERLTSSILADPRTHQLAAAQLPQREVVVAALDRLTWLMFPGYFGPSGLEREDMHAHVAGVTLGIAKDLREQVAAALRYEVQVHPEDASAAARSGPFAAAAREADTRADELVHAYIARLPEVRALLTLDVQAAFDGDPAARHTDEIIFSYPGVRAITIHRLAHELHRLQVPLIPRMMSEHGHSLTGIDIHPGARIGKAFFIDHGTGVVIGETTVIGDHCRIYQGVTLGARNFEKDNAGRMVRGQKRHPTLEDHVIVFAGATILGGDTVIGAGTVVNGGVFLTQSVPPGHIVRGPKAEIKLRSNPELPPANFSI
jgi:serine O-acetyltransferase